MAHVQKFKKTGMGNVFAHIDRKDDYKNKVRDYSNENIDKSKTYLNYNLNQEFGLDISLTSKQRLDKRLEETTPTIKTTKRTLKEGVTEWQLRQLTKEYKEEHQDCTSEEVKEFREQFFDIEEVEVTNNKKSINVCCSLVVQLPKDENGELVFKTREEQKEFFRGVCQYMCDKWGQENLIDLSVHYDETTPHLHGLFCPVTQEGQLNCAKVITLETFQQLHQEMQIYLEDYLERDDFSIFDSETSTYGKLSCKEYKAQKRLEELEQQVQTTQEQLTQQENALVERANSIQGIDKLITLGQNYSQDMQELQSVNYTIQEQAYLKEKDLKEQITQLQEELKKIKEEKDKIQKENEELRKQKKSLAQEANEKIHKANDIIQSKNKIIQSKDEQLASKDEQIKKLNDELNYHPMDKYTAKEGEWADNFDKRELEL